jgi:hypothetical protein
MLNVFCNNDAQQVFAQNMTKTGGEGIPIALQKTVQSMPDPTLVMNSIIKL